MKTRYFLAMIALAGGLTACNADMDYTIAAPVVSALEASDIHGSLNGDDYEITWPATTPEVLVARYADGSKNGEETVKGNKYIHKNVDTNIKYEYVLKAADGKGNFSKGVIMEFTRPGAGKCSKLAMAQIEKVGGYDAKVEWSTEGSNATQVIFSATNGTTTITETLDASVTEYTIPNVVEGETWAVTLVAKNNEGTSLPITSSLRIGKLAVAFLCEYDTPEELIANGDDDEAYAWIWFHKEYPTGKFLPFSEISSAEDLSQYRVLFWIRDLETGKMDDAFTYSDIIQNATPAIAEWYKDGGSLLLWSHATTYIEKLGRIPEGSFQSGRPNINTGKGGVNNDTWKMSVQHSPDNKFVKDHSTHPLYKGLKIEPTADNKLLAVKGPGWTEDHNCLFFDYPAKLTGKSDKDEECYNILTATYGIFPLGTWDGEKNQISQLNIWEAQKGNTEFNGTILCVGNGGCEFYMKDNDGKADVEKVPSANIYQSNIEKMATNAIEYLKTR